MEVVVKRIREFVQRDAIMVLKVPREATASSAGVAVAVRDVRVLYRPPILPYILETFALTRAVAGS